MFRRAFRRAAIVRRTGSRNALFSSLVGSRVIVEGVGTDPLSALDKYVKIVPMEFPNTASLDDDAVVIKVHSAAVHWVDLLMLAGQYQHAPPPPYSPGMEYSGEIAWTGPNASIGVGEAVYVDIFSAGPRSYGNYQKYGGMATYAVAPASAVHKVPAQLSMAEASSFCGAYETAHHGLVHSGSVKRGETVLVHGATGATGLAAVQICSALGADVIATGSCDEKLEVVRQVGARGDGKIIATHNYRSDESLRECVKGAAPDGVVDMVYDTVGGNALSENELALPPLWRQILGHRMDVHAVCGWRTSGGRSAANCQHNSNKFDYDEGCQGNWISSRYRYAS